MKQYVPEGFSSSNGRLAWHNRDLVELGSKYGTPLIVYSRDAVEYNFQRLDLAFRKYSRSYSIKYAVKANSNATLLSIIRNQGAGADASSYGEINAAIDAGFPPESISFSPNNVSRSELKFAADLGIDINFDSIGQFLSLGDYLPKTVSFRIKSEYGRGEFKGTTTSGYGAKFGELPSNALMGYRKAKQAGCNSFGIHIMTGSNVTDAEHFLRVAGEISEIALKISKEAGIEFEYLDMGGGFGVPYRPGENALNMEKAAQNICTVVKERFEEAGLPVPRIVLEPGRYIVANAAVMLGTVYDVKKQEMNYVGTDIGMNILIRPALYGAYHHVVLANKMDSDPDFPCEITGQICENTDRIASGRMIPEPHPGDMVAVFNAGAYVRSMASNYNGRPFPTEVLLDKGSDFAISGDGSKYSAWDSN